MQEPSFDLNLIRVFTTIFEKRSVSAAASDLCLTQSATSHALSRLRQEFDDPLFVRSSGAMLPTPYAELLASSIHRPLEELEAGLRLVRKFDPATSDRTFTLYLTDIGQLIMLPAMLQYVAKHAPKIRFHVRSVPKLDPHAAMAYGEVDLAVGHITSIPDGFFQKLLFRETYVCVVRADHPLFLEGMSVEAFQEVQHAITDSTGMSHEILDRFLEKNNMQRSVQLRVPQFVALPFVIPSTDLLVIMPSRLAHHLAPLIPIKILPLPVEFPPYDIRTFWHSRYHHDPANIWLRQLLTNLFSDAAT